MLLFIVTMDIYFWYRWTGYTAIFLLCISGSGQKVDRCPIS